MSSTDEENEFPKRLGSDPKSRPTKIASFSLKLRWPFYYFQDVETFLLSDKVRMVCFNKNGKIEYIWLERTEKIKQPFFIFSWGGTGYMNTELMMFSPKKHYDHFLWALDPTVSDPELDWIDLGTIRVRWEDGKTRLKINRDDEQFILTPCEAQAMSVVMFPQYGGLK